MDTPGKINPVSIAIQLVLVLVLLPLLPLLVSGHWGWWQAWVLAALQFLGFIVSRALAARKHPDILAERAGSMGRQDAASWDRLLAPTMAFGSVLAPLVAGLDERFTWSPPYSLALEVLGLALILLGYALATYALVENRFFSGVVRLQTERGHAVCSSGPYRWVRHPGYAGSLLASLGMPLLLASTWAFLPAAALTAVAFVRTALEDRFLQDNLPGYQDYASRVRFRLIPGVW